MTDQPTIVLNRFIPLQEFQPVWLGFLRQVYHQVCLPTETVITGPEIVMPLVARQYCTDFYWYQDKACSCHELHAAVLASGQHFCGTAHYDEIYLVEVWEDHGDDGHVDYQQVGWRFVLAAALVDDPQAVFPKVPACMQDRGDA